MEKIKYNFPKYTLEKLMEKPIKEIRKLGYNIGIKRRSKLELAKLILEYNKLQWQLQYEIKGIFK